VRSPPTGRPAPTATPEVFARYRARLDRALREAVEGPDLPLYTMARYQMGWVDRAGNPVAGDRGKTVRPTLCLLMCEALGGNPDHALPAAAGLELLHNFSLVHDDIMDQDHSRRGRPTVWDVWGVPQAIDAGDLMHVLATLSALRGPPGPDGPLLAAEAVAVLARGCSRMTEGQHLDIAFESRDDVTLDQYLGMVDGKTAALIGTAFELGAVFAGNNRDVRSACREYGRTLGTAFQIRDDILGIWGEPETTGKPVGSDLMRRKKTWPVVHAWHHAAPADQARLHTMFQSRACAPDVADATAILERAGSREAAEAQVSQYQEASDAWLRILPVSAWGRAQLVEVARYIAQRAK